MLGRMVAWVIVAFVISGCVTERDGTDFAALAQKVGPPKPGRAPIVVFREKGYGGLADEGWEIQLDGQPMGGLKTGTYVYADRPAGRHKLSVNYGAVSGRDTVRNDCCGWSDLFFSCQAQRAGKDT
jgi:hypothetical protein